MRYSKPNISLLRSFRVLRYRGAINISSLRDWSDLLRELLRQDTKTITSSASSNEDAKHADGQAHDDTEGCGK
jgi:hypothetical protein